MGDNMTASSSAGPVLVVGAGPVGLTMAAELARHGVRCRLIDRALQPSPYCRAIGVTPRTLEAWEDMGIAMQMIDRGLWLTGIRSVIADQPAVDTIAPTYDLPYGELGLAQYETERVLTEHLAGFGISVERGAELKSLAPDDADVTATIGKADGAVEEAKFAYVIGCDGAHSAVRKGLGIEFQGEAFPWPFMLGDVHIDWDVPYGMAFRAVRPKEDAPPDMFIAIPLPEPGRYRVSMMAPPHLVSNGGTDHGIQSEMKGPSLADLQAMADDMVPGKPRLTDLRWSSIFRISMRLAVQYRQGRVFIAGDAAHIHPPTGGQGMNTGIQDAYNLAWKLALVLRGEGRPELLDTYEPERQAVGLEVIERTVEASKNYGRERGKAPDRLADTQVLVSYRGGPRTLEDAAGAAGPVAGDRAPDVQGLQRHGIGFPLRLFEVLKGTGHVLLLHVAEGEAEEAIAHAKALREQWGSLRVVAISRTPLPDTPYLAGFVDAVGEFARAYGGEARAILVRPDGYIGWRGTAWGDQGIKGYLGKVFSS